MPTIEMATSIDFRQLSYSTVEVETFPSLLLSIHSMLALINSLILNSFVSNVTFLYPLNHQKTLVFLVLSGGIKI